MRARERKGKSKERGRGRESKIKGGEGKREIVMNGLRIEELRGK